MGGTGDSAAGNSSRHGVVSFDRNPDPCGATFLWVPIVVFSIIHFRVPAFNRTVGKRYRGRALTFLSWAYFLGRIIAGPALWLGSCLLSMR